MLFLCHFGTLERRRKTVCYLPSSDARSFPRFASETRWALYWLVVSNNFHSYLGKISNLTNIFQMGGNHQLVKDGFLLFFWWAPINNGVLELTYLYLGTKIGPQQLTHGKMKGFYTPNIWAITPKKWRLRVAGIFVAHLLRPRPATLQDSPSHDSLTDGTLGLSSSADGLLG